ncbi:YfhO family protein [Paenibacillus sp. alder61]|uniref:YfhO family protein n=1 Tax=Paenibacillus sp. alder61 TaxID=2862948 RepID=UPI001CD6B356|nr:YfhO family protein [Paenibacillus sp. alder61]MCA1293918.1 YfhO family protein [Paenibacillus sp. alder61]
MNKITSKGTNLLVFLFFLGVVLIVYMGTIKNSLLVNGDGITYFISKFFLVDSLKSGELPLWNPFVSIGNPFLADIQQTVFSPFNLLFLFFSPITGFNVYHVLQLTFAGFFMYLYINELFQKKYIGVLVGFIFLFSGMLGGNRIEHTTIITTIIFFPLILFLLERFKRTAKDSYLIFLSVVMAFHFLSGFTQIVIYYNLVFLVYFFYVCKSLKYSLGQTLKKMVKWLSPYILLCGVQLVPTMQLMMQSGRNDVSYDFFSVLSYDLRILMMMIFPNVYLNKFESFGEYASSGMDIEIYLGIIPFIYLLYSLVYYFKDTFVRLIAGIMIGSFIYGMAPHIPILGKIIHSLPILGSFRVSARILSIFLICGLILFAYTLSKLDEIREIKRLIKFSGLLTIGIILICFAIFSTLSQHQIPSEISQHYSLKGEVFLPILALCFINLICLCIIYVIKKKEKYTQRIIPTILSLLCFVTIFDVGKYSIVKNATSSEMALGDSSKKIYSLAKENIDYRSFALLKLPEQYYDDQLLTAKFQRSMIAKLKFFNSYSTFIDKKLQTYNIDETAFYPHTMELFNTKNDLLSMMSIRFIYDAWNQEFNKYIATNEVEEVLLNKENLVINKNNSQLSVMSFPIKLEPDTAYQIQINMKTTTTPKLFYVDFYNNTYDNPEQDGSFGEILPELVDYKTVIFTGDSVPSDQVYFRIVTETDDDITINQLNINKLKTIQGYKEILNEGDLVVYENIYAKPILFSPSKIESVDSFEPIYSNSNERLDEVSFIQSFNKELDLGKANTKISNIEQKNNSIKATVTSNNDTFINHTQLFYPGWKAYVDGKQVPIYKVNNLIQGAEVPKGTHVISFVYDPLDVKIGAIISLFGVLLCLYHLLQSFLYNQIKKRKV